MIKTFQISFSLKSTYRVNSILYSLKQIPLLRRLLPSSLYSLKELKILSYAISGLWEFVSIFAGKFFYFLALVCGIGVLYDALPKDAVFLHILFFLTVVGTFCNTSLFRPSKDKYYSMILMRMDAKKYSLTSYLYYSLKIILGFMPFTVLFGWANGVPVWLCLLLPLCVAGMKAFFVGSTLWLYEKKEVDYNENKQSLANWVIIGLFLALAYALPLFGFVLPAYLTTLLFLLGLPLGVIGFIKIFTFHDYPAVNRSLLSTITAEKADSTQITKQATEKRISEDTSIGSNKTGFEYLNDLFIKRHKKTLWNVTKRITYVCLILLSAAQLAMYKWPEIKPFLNTGVMTCLPYFLFIMYCLNRGTSFTQALFMNCDHSLLTYAFYKKPDFILKLFRIRLREIMKINAVPALVIGTGLALTLYTSGGTDDPLNYVVLIVSVLCMSLFFSVHYLTMYYLLQPYNAGTELKSGTYRLVSTLTYFVCYFLMLQRIPTLLFGTLTIVFVLLYCIIASILVYYLAPKTFRIRM